MRPLYKGAHGHLRVPEGAGKGDKSTYWGGGAFERSKNQGQSVASRWHGAHAACAAALPSDEVGVVGSAAGHAAALHVLQARAARRSGQSSRQRHRLRPRLQPSCRQAEE